MRLALLLVLFFSAAPSMADPVFTAGSCQQDKKDTCIDATPCKKIGDVTACLAGTVDAPANSVMMTESCWQYDAAFTCRDSSSVDTCSPLRAKGCGQVNTQCLTYTEDGKCQSATLTFQCPDKPATVKETTVCDTSLCQADGTGCFNTRRRYAT